MAEELKEGQELAFEEFKLFYESAEKVTDRRLQANRWNYSICIAILAVVPAIINWGLAKPAFLLTSIVVVTILSAMAVLFCSLWIGQIRDLKELNNAKFAILNEMAPHLSFGDNPGDTRTSYRPFEREWDALKKATVAQEIRSLNLVALKSSNIEYLVPKAFRILFLTIILVVVIEGVRQYDTIRAASESAQPENTTQQETQR